MKSHQSALAGWLIAGGSNAGSAFTHTFSSPVGTTMLRELRRQLPPRSCALCSDPRQTCLADTESQLHSRSNCGSSKPSSFLAGYLHQDWDVEYADAIEAAIDYARTERSATVRVTMNELKQLIEADMSEEALAKWRLNVGCYFRPSGPSRAWLSQLHDVMADEVNVGE
jgi:hypothetical protein